MSKGTSARRANKPSYNLYLSNGRPPRRTETSVIQAVLRVGDIAMMVGGSNAGKSTSVIHLTQSVVRGRPWFGRKTTATPVLYCCAEGPDAVEAAEKAWLGHHNEIASSQIAYCEEGFGFDDAEQVKQFVETVRAFESKNNLKFGIIVFDTLADYLGNIEENSNTEMRKVNLALRWIAKKLGCAILLVHHFGKDEGRGPRGAAALNAKLDVRLDCWSDGDLTILEVGKMRRGKNGARFVARREAVVVGVDSFGDPETACIMIEQLGEVPLSAVPASLTLDQAILNIVTAIPKPVDWSDVRTSLKALGFAIDEAGRVAAERARDKLAKGPNRQLDYDKKSKLVSLVPTLPTTVIVASNVGNTGAKPEPAEQPANDDVVAA
ncbi:MAG: AAA family ATPase [Rhodospirillaceae bacterium]|nr:AAA family ATPase [Rhodospirillaceae bacterium]